MAAMATPLFECDFECLIQERCAEHARVIQSLTQDSRFLSSMNEAAAWLIATYQSGHRVFIAGNGGSAADAQHFAAEMVGRFQQERPGLFAVALTVDTSALTAIGNDYGFDAIFTRQLESLGSSGDLFIGISTSGNSMNVLNAFDTARDRGLKTLALTGGGGGRAKTAADLVLEVPSQVTARVQECHILILHLLCELVETSLYPADKAGQ